jgi:flagellar motility protein MotE (MotC chaperone)
VAPKVVEDAMKRFLLLTVAVFFGLMVSYACGATSVDAGAKSKPVQATSKEVAQASTVLAREQAVAAKEEALAKKEQELALLQTELDGKLARYAKLQKEVAGQLNELKGIQGKRFKNLIAVYSAMSPTKVAPLLNSMEDNTVAEVLQAMKTDLVAKIVPKLDPDKGVRVSKRLGLIQ